MLRESGEKTNYPKVSVVILNYNGKEFVEDCLNSVLNSNYPNSEVIFVDDASTDGSLELAKDLCKFNPRAIFVKNKHSLGFAWGNNVGASYATGKYLVFLNVDTKVDSQWLRELTKAMESSEEVGVGQCKTLLMDDPERIDKAGNYKHVFGFAISRGVSEKDHGQFDSVHNIFSAEGTAMITRRDLFERLDGFDKEFFILYEDDDFCWRAWLQGYRTIYIFKAIVYHKRSAIRSKRRILLNLYYSKRNSIASILKNYEFKNIVKYYVLGFSVAFVRSMLTRPRRMHLRAFLSAFFWNVRNIKKTISKRRRTQSQRKVEDEYLMKLGVMRKNVMETLR